MSDPPAEKKPPASYSLYGDLLAPREEREGGVISAAPVTYEMRPRAPEPEAAKKKNATIQFAPVKRPVQKKGKSKTSNAPSGPRFPSTMGVAGAAAGRAAVAADSSSPDKQLPSSTPQQPPVGHGLSYDDIVQNIDPDEDDELYANTNKRKWAGRGGKKHKNKKNKREEEVDQVDWDAIYDPARPTNLALYRGSDEQNAERDDWTRFLHYHNKKANKHLKVEKPSARNNMFAPPPNLSFAPPAFGDDPSAGIDPMDVDDDEYQPSPARWSGLESSAPVSHFAPSAMPQDPTGEDAYMRRLRMSGAAPQAVPQEPSAPSPPPAQPAAAAVKPAIDMAAKVAEAQARLAATKARIEAQHAQNATGPVASPIPPAAFAPSQPPPPPAQPTDTSIISAAPVRYNLADSQVDALLDSEDARAQTGSPSLSQSQSQSPAPNAPSSKMPGQRDFGARMMAKMGWKKGEGLGARGEGITTALIAQPTKRKKRSDGKWSQQIGKIMGGRKNKVQTTDDDDYGLISNVVKLQGMLDGLDVAFEIEEKNLMQEIGEQFSQTCGPIERLFIWREENGGNDQVFIKFTNQISALNACKGTNGVTFADNPVSARFFNAEKFENGEYA